MATTPVTMPALIDAHVHCFPAVRGVRLGTEQITSEGLGFVRRGDKGLERFLPPTCEHTSFSAEVLREYLVSCGITKAVLFQSSVYGAHNGYYQDHFLRKDAEHFRAFALVDPREQGSSERIRKLVVEEGFVGIKVELPDLPVRADEKAMSECCAVLQDAGGTLAIDLGWEPESPDFFQLDRLKRLLRQFPKVRLHVTHFALGGREVGSIDGELIRQISELASIGTNVMFDISAFPWICSDEKEFPYPEMQKLLERILEVVPPTLLMWGSDGPQILRRCTYAQCFRWISDHPHLTAKQKLLILFENAERWYFPTRD